ncbi:MAG TPA: hypothetical protein VMM35_03310 [Longimicrobiales bacterium]|nr:hypothetical protein [Longimicrobiales bacterium]
MSLAARGTREVGGRVEPIADSWLVRQLRRQAREVHVEAILVAALLTGLTLLIPG